MPTYVYRCPTCGSKRDIVKPLANLNRFEFCHVCHDHEPMIRMLSAPAIAKDYEGYSCPVTGKWIEGKIAHEDNLARTGCRILEPGEAQENERRREADNAKLDAAVDHTVEGFVHNLPTAKREALISEIAAGADTVMTRASP